jgi:hypothetical protein
MQIVGKNNVQANKLQEREIKSVKEGVADWGPRQHHGHGAVGLASPVWTVDSHAHHPNKTGRASDARYKNISVKQARTHM